MDHRHGTRHAVRWPVVLQFGDRRHHGTILDISLTGAYIRTSARVTPPAFVDLKLLTVSQAWQPRAPALVIRTDAYGIAVEWQSSLQFAAPQLFERLAGPRRAAANGQSAE